MTRNFSVLVAILSILLVASQCYSQLTFSKNWGPPAGKRSGHNMIPIPEVHFQLSANSICQYLLSEMKQMTTCDSRTEEGASIFSTN